MTNCHKQQAARSQNVRTPLHTLLNRLPGSVLDLTVDDVVVHMLARGNAFVENANVDIAAWAPAPCLEIMRVAMPGVRWMPRKRMRLDGAYADNTVSVMANNDFC